MKHIQADKTNITIHNKAIHKAQTVTASQTLNSKRSSNIPLNTLSIGHFRDDFYRPDDQTNSVKALKETSWLSSEPLQHVTVIQL